MCWRIVKIELANISHKGEEGDVMTPVLLHCVDFFFKLAYFAANHFL